MTTIPTSGSLNPTALIADDEPLLREHLAKHLALVWPELTVVAHARNGREALELFDQFEPHVVFLDVQMPGLTGLDAARSMVGRTEIVFVTAYEQFAVQAFERGALDYLVKPFDDERLAQTVQRLRQRLTPLSIASAQPPQLLADSLAAEDLLNRLAQALGRAVPTQPAQPRLQWIKAGVGAAVRLIAVDEVSYLRSDEKYTVVCWTGGEALIRKTIRELAEELDPAVFVQIHRSTIVNLRHIAQVVRGTNETASVHLHASKEVLQVSRSYLHVFRQM